MTKPTRSQSGSISSAGSLTFSEYSAFSDCLNTPPPFSPRSPSCFQFETSPASSTSSSSSLEEDYHDCDKDSAGISSEAAAALHRLNLDLPPNFYLPPQSPGSENGSDSSSVRKTKMKKRPSGLKMDLSNVQRFDPPMPSTATLLGAPLIGCLPTPSPTTLNFSITPKPGLSSRFSDDSVSPSPSTETPPFSSGNPWSARASTSSAFSGNGWPSPAPITPGTVNALDCFGISSSAASSCLMRRGGSRDSKGSPLAPKSPDQSRHMPRSPLAMPSMHMSRSMSRSRSTSSPGSNCSNLISASEAKSLYHTLLPGDKAKTGDLPTPGSYPAKFEWVQEEDAVVQGLNPYFPTLRV